MKHRVIMSGGLGNQMFQYAFYLRLNAEGKECIIDDTLFHIVSMHNGFELSNVFHINEQLKAPSKIKKAWILFLRRYKPRFFVCSDKEYNYCPWVFDSKCPFYIGDWLSPLYFEDIKEEIMECFQFHGINDRNLRIASRMKEGHSVSIHIRRGDYLNNLNYCVCTEEYYRSAINIIQKTVSEPMFYVFSDDPAWCTDFMSRFNVPFDVVDWNRGRDSFQDMYLMTQCKHNIIANSTFSWWGAWLNTNESKVIIAPRKWFRESYDNINYCGWLVL